MIILKKRSFKVLPSQDIPLEYKSGHDLGLNSDQICDGDKNQMNNLSFQFLAEEGKNLPSMDKRFGFALQPHPFRCQIRHRFSQ